MSHPIVAFVNVHVVPMDGDRVLWNQAVVVKGDRIFSVAPASEITLPTDAQTINGAGGYLMPGLADMHTHLDMRDPDPAHLVLYLAEGTTLVRSMNGTATNATWREQVARGEIAGPTILTAGSALIGQLPPDVSDSAPFAMPVFTPATPSEAVAEVNRQAHEWVDFIKVYDGLPEEIYLAAIQAARDAEIYVAGHALDEASLQTVLESGINEIAHIDELNSYHWLGTPDMADFRLDLEMIPATAAMMKENEVAVVSNLVADETMISLLLDAESVLERPIYRSVRPEIMTAWKSHGRHLHQFAGQDTFRRDHEMPFFKELLHTLQQADVPITVGTDTSTLEGSSPQQIHREIELLVEAGFSEFEALAAATRNASTVVDRMGRDGEFGTVEPGQRADLLLLNANPLEDVSRTQSRVGVMTRGIWRTQEQLDHLVAQFLATF